MVAEDVAGKTVLVTGCGPIGLLAIGIARASGATCIFAAEVSPLRRQLAERMGATRVLNPLEVDMVEAVRAETNGDGVDVLLEMSGNATALRQGLQALTQGGRVSLLGLLGTRLPRSEYRGDSQRRAPLRHQGRHILPPGIKQHAFYSLGCSIPHLSSRIASRWQSSIRPWT